MNQLVQVQVECRLANLPDLVDGLLQSPQNWIFSTQVVRHYGLESGHFSRQQAVLGYEERGMIVMNTQAELLAHLQADLAQMVSTDLWSWVVLPRLV